MLQVEGKEIRPDKVREIVITSTGRRYIFIGYNEDNGNPAQVRTLYSNALWLQIRENRLSVSEI